MFHEAIQKINDHGVYWFLYLTYFITMAVAVNAQIYSDFQYPWAASVETYFPLFFIR